MEIAQNAKSRVRIFFPKAVMALAPPPSLPKLWKLLLAYMDLKLHTSLIQMYRSQLKLPVLNS